MGVQIYREGRQREREGGNARGGKGAPEFLGRAVGGVCVLNVEAPAAFYVLPRGTARANDGWRDRI